MEEWKDKNDNYNKHIEMSFDYKGFLKMITLFAVKHIRRIVVEVVYEGDLFEVNTLAEPPIKHSPQFKSKEDKDIQFAYMAWQYEYGEYGGWEYEVMTREDLDQVQKCSKTDNIWKQWYKEMAKKSVVRRARKRIPLTWKNNFEAEKIWNEQIEQETDFSKLDKPQEKHEVIDVDCEVQNG